MTGLAILFLVISLIIVWGGLAASIVFLARRPDVDRFPPGGEDDERVDAAPVIRDT